MQYLSHDRPDLALAAVILANKMAKPQASDIALLQRVASYLQYCPCMVQHFPWQLDAPHNGLQAYSDSDWASCQTSRKSRSGGVLFFKGRAILHYCRTQDCIALSSGEAELKASCKILAEVLGIQSLVEFLYGHKCTIEHLTDAQAALGMLKRAGSGGLKHLCVRQLWVQEIARRPEVTNSKVPRALNPADALCSGHTVQGLSRHMTHMGYFPATPPV